MNKGKIIGGVFTIFGLALLGLGLILYLPYQKNRNSIDKLRAYAISDSVPNFGTYEGKIQNHSENRDDENRDEADRSTNRRMIDFTYIKNVNEDIIGWIMIPDTHIDYPVLQGDTLEQYLNQGYDGQYNTLGSIFTYPETDLKESRHIILFGHRTFDHQMFGDLNNFSDQDYAQKHNVYLYTEDESQVYYPIASYLCSPQDITLSEMTNTEDYR